MNTDPHYEPVDPVDLILAQEQFEDSADYAAAVAGWMVNDDITLAFGRDRFYVDAQYGVAFAEWLAGR